MLTTCAALQESKFWKFLLKDISQKTWKFCFWILTTPSNETRECTAASCLPDWVVPKVKTDADLIAHIRKCVVKRQFVDEQYVARIHW